MDKSFRVKDVYVKTDEDGDWKQLSPLAFMGDGAHTNTTTQPITNTSFSVNFEVQSFDEKLYRELHHKLVVEPVIRHVLDELEKIKAEGQVARAVVMSQEWSDALPGLKEKLAERDVRLWATPYLPDEGANSFYIIKLPEWAV